MLNTTGAGSHNIIQAHDVLLKDKYGVFDDWDTVQQALEALSDNITLAERIFRDDGISLQPVGASPASGHIYNWFQTNFDRDISGDGIVYQHSEDGNNVWGCIGTNLLFRMDNIIRVRTHAKLSDEWAVTGNGYFVGCGNHTPTGALIASGGTSLTTTLPVFGFLFKAGETDKIHAMGRIKASGAMATKQINDFDPHEWHTYETTFSIADGVFTAKMLIDQVLVETFSSNDFVGSVGLRHLVALGDVGSPGASLFVAQKYMTAGLIT